jgi:polar amino acid transport system substrate-binding protein
LCLVEEPVLDERRFSAFTTDPDMDIDAWSDLAPFHVGYVRGWKIFEQGAAGARSATPVRSTELLFGLLGMGRIDVALSAELDGRAMARRLGIEVMVHEPPLAARTMYLYLHCAHREHIPCLARALEAMKADGTMAALRRETAARYLDPAGARGGREP